MSLDYFKDRSAISNSMLKKLEDSFLDFYKWYVEKEEEPINHNFAGGQYLHMRMEQELLKDNPDIGEFEQDYIFITVEKIDKRTKAGKAQFAEIQKKYFAIAADNPEKEVYLLEQKEKDNVEAMIPFLRNKLKYFDKSRYKVLGVEQSGKMDYIREEDKIAMEAAFIDGLDTEEAPVYTIKGTCDLLVLEIETGRKIIVDWKNTKVYKEWLKRARNFKYPRAGYMYKNIFDADSVEFIVIDTDTQQVMEVTMSDNALDQGQAMLDGGLKMFDFFKNTYNPLDIEKRTM